MGRFILVRFVCSSWCQLSGFSDKDCSPGTGEQGRNTFTKGNLCPAFRQIAEGRELFVNLLCLLPSAQNNLYAEVAYFGVAYSDCLHVQPLRIELAVFFYVP